jgi:hypothetical protein
MTTQVPTIGRIVHYTLSEQDAESINRRRKDAANHVAEIRDAAIGYVTDTGNEAQAGQMFPMLITRAWGDQPQSCVNGQVFLDGNDVLWATSVSVGGPGEHRKFIWPPRVTS